MLVFAGFTFRLWIFPKLDVVGSNPIARFRKTLLHKQLRPFFIPVTIGNVDRFRGSSVVVPCGVETERFLSGFLKKTCAAM